MPSSLVTCSTRAACGQTYHGADVSRQLLCRCRCCQGHGHVFLQQGTSLQLNVPAILRSFPSGGGLFRPLWCECWLLAACLCRSYLQGFMSHRELTHHKSIANQLPGRLWCVHGTTVYGVTPFTITSQMSVCQCNCSCCIVQALLEDVKGARRQHNLGCRGEAGYETSICLCCQLCEQVRGGNDCQRAACRQICRQE